MPTVYAIHDVDVDKLSRIVKEMQAMGPPAIEVIDCGDFWMATEGSHRLAAASGLGITPRWTLRDQHDLIDVTRYDWYDEVNWGGKTYTAGEIAGELYSTDAVAYAF